MKISVSQKLEAEISPQEHKRVVLEFFYKYYNWKKDFFVKKINGVLFLYARETFHTSHSWEEETEIREATVQDILIHGVIESIKRKTL